MGRKWHSKVFHEPGGGDHRNRDIFPLPTLSGGGELPEGVCRASARRFQRREHIRKRVNMAIHALNSLFFGRVCPEAGEIGNLSSLPLCQRECIRGLVQRIQAFGAPPSTASRQGALAVLRAASNGYQEPEAGVGEVVDFVLDQLSLPSGRVAGVDLESSLDGPLQTMVADFENWMLQDASAWSDLAEEAHKIKPYNDPSLSDRSQYISFLKHVNKCGILGTTACCRGRVGAFAVSKKPKFDGGVWKLRQRLILDCRQVNLQFKAPPRCELGALSALCEIVLGEDQTLYTSGADIQDCFYAARISSEMSNFFCLVSDINLFEARVVFGENFIWEHEHDRISPCITVLPMGFSWSFYIIQKLHEQSALRSLQCDRSSLVLDGYPAPDLAGSSVVAMPYCDNLHSLSLSAEACQAGKASMAADLSDMGFSLHEEVDATDYFPTLGGIIDGSSGVIKCTPTRGWNIIYAFESLLDGPVSWETVRRLLGHSMTLCTLNRCGMAVFRSLYDFVEAAPQPRPLNHKERQEVLNFVGIVPLLVGELKRNWSSTVTCTDASPDGYGICERQLDQELVHDIGRWQDRWRFRHLGPEDWKPRERLAGLDPLLDIRTARTFRSPQTVEDMYAYNDFFPEVSEHITQPEHWQTKLMGKWGNRSEHITLKEGRALVLALKRMTRTSSTRNQRHLVLVDNLGLCLAVCKGRASNFHFLRIMQQVSALSLAGAFTVRARWIRSEANVADGPSRGQIRPGPFLGVPSDQKPRPESKGISDQKGSRRCEEEFSSVEGAPAFTSSEAILEQEEFGGQPCVGSQELQGPEDLEPHPGSGFGGGQPSKGQQAHDPGAEVGQPSHRDTVCQLLPEIREFLQGEQPRPTTKSTNGRPSCRVHGHHVCRGQRHERGREDPCQRGVPPLLPERKNVKVKKGFERLAKRDATRISAPFAKGDSIWHEHGPPRETEEGDGAKAHSRLRHLHEARREPRFEGQQLGGSSEESWPTVPLVQCGGAAFRRPETRQGGGVRQQHPIQLQGQRVDRRDDASPREEAEEEKVRPHLRLHGRGVPEGIPEGWSDDGAGRFASISAPARGRCRRPQFQGQRLSKCKGKRQMADRCQCAKIHKGGQGAAAVEPVVKKTRGVLSLVSSQPGEGVSGSSSSPKPAELSRNFNVFKNNTLPHKFCLEVFAGTARITTSLNARSLPAFPIDICLDPLHDVLSIHVEHRIFNWISSGRVRFIWCGMPCTSFSKARKWDGLGPGPLRTSQHLWGLPGLSEADKKKVATGNRLLHFTVRLLTQCVKHSVLYVLENPNSSMAWDMPPLKRFLQSHHPFSFVLDYCQFGEPWKKPTRLLANFDLSPIALRCNTVDDRCSRTKRPHVALAGLDSSGIFMTLRAQPYPIELTEKIASLVAETLKGKG